MEGLVLVICDELDRVCHESDDKEYVVRCLERGARSFGDLIYRERNHQQNQVLRDCFRKQGEHCEVVG